MIYTTFDVRRQDRAVGRNRCGIIHCIYLAAMLPRYNVIIVTAETPRPIFSNDNCTQTFFSLWTQEFVRHSNDTNWAFLLPQCGTEIDLNFWFLIFGFYYIIPLYVYQMTLIKIGSKSSVNDVEKNV